MLNLISCSAIRLNRPAAQHCQEAVYLTDRYGGGHLACTCTSTTPTTLSQMRVLTATVNLTSASCSLSIPNLGRKTHASPKVSACDIPSNKHVFHVGIAAPCFQGRGLSGDVSYRWCGVWSKASCPGSRHWERASSWPVHANLRTTTRNWPFSATLGFWDKNIGVCAGAMP